MPLKFFAAVFLLSLTAVVAADPSAVTGNSYGDFYDLKKDEAEKRGKADAKRDFAAGKYRVLVYGLRRGPTEGEKDLAKLGIHVDAIAGCIVSDGILGYAHGYNSTMEPLLKKKFGADIFKKSGLEG